MNAKRATQQPSTKGIRRTIFVPILLVGLASVIGLNMYASSSSEDLIEGQSVKSAKKLVSMIREIRAYYTKNVVKRVKSHGIKITQNYATTDGAVPLPATMVHDLTSILSKKDKYTARLYSDYPFPWRTDGGARDTFERDALSALKANPGEDYWRVEDVAGVPTVRFASADLMMDGCVGCHNSHPDTPKSDWVAGDLRGVLEVSVPIQDELDTATAMAHSIGIGSAGIVGLLLMLTIYLVARGLRPLRKMADAASEIAEGHMPPEIEYRSSDEVGQLADSFRQLTAYMNNAVESVSQVAAGNLEVEVVMASDCDELGTATTQMKQSLQRLTDDVRELTESAVAGRLSARADVSRHQGEYARIIEAINETMHCAVNPMGEAQECLDRLANYDLRARIEGEFNGDHALLKNSVNKMATVLNEALSQVATAASQASSASSQIASGSQAIAQGASEQASSLEETSSSLEEMTGMTKQTADNTRQAKALSESTREAAQLGNQSMRELATAMTRIHASAEGTAQIIGDINEIAFQTNLLALNAAVEAARAGDAGRGFAVVAEEVRNLALRSKDAAKRTEDLIKESVELARQGGGLSDAVTSNLDGIVESVTKVASIVAEITVASEEQARGIDQVNRAVAEMDKVVQQAAASSEETSSAAEELAGQSHQLESMVGRFTLS